jgi:Cu-Zn family superoxide dismutase
MRIHHALPALALAAAAAACTPTYTTAGSTGATPAPAASSGGDMSGMTQYSANLAAMNGSTVHGTAMVHSMAAGQQTVALQISGGTAGATYPWHIHTGSCSEGMTSIVGSGQLYTALGTSGDGTASLTTNVPVTLDPAQRYHVNVHASPTDMGTIVACGDLTR